MKERQIKIKIFLIQVVDWLFLISVFSVGINAVFFSENLNLMVTIFLVGMFLLNGLGQITLNKIATLRMELEKIHNK